MKSCLYRLSLLGVVLAALSLNTAIADDPISHRVSTTSISVSFADLNLANPEDIASLFRRVESAARKVCGVRSMLVSVTIARENRKCASRAIENAIRQVDDARLTALYHSKLENILQS